MAKFIIIGIDDPYSMTPLQPDIINSSGQKVWSMTGLTMTQYVKFFERRNLFNVNDNKTNSYARLKAGGMLRALDNSEAETYVICLGKVVAEGFGLQYVSPLKFRKVRRRIWAAYLPHTSGLNRWYNSADNRRSATDFMRVVSSAASGEIEDEHIQEILEEL